MLVVTANMCPSTAQVLSDLVLTSLLPFNTCMWSQSASSLIPLRYSFWKRCIWAASSSLNVAISHTQLSMQIYERNVMFRQQVGNLQLIVGIYNNVQATILPVEKPLITQKLEAVDSALKKGLQVKTAYKSLRVYTCHMGTDLPLIALHMSVSLRNQRDLMHMQLSANWASGL